MNIHDTYSRWLKLAVKDPDLSEELKAMREEQIEDAFYREVSFGTGGIRGVIGAGTNRINIYTCAKASQGVSDYLKKTPGEKKVVIAYDSRIKSDLFAKHSAEVFAANGIHTYLFDRLMPTPVLSYAVRALGCDAGIVITASHNPSKYNGYKVYNAEGCQITDNAANAIYREIEKLDFCDDVKEMPYEEAVTKGLIESVPETVFTGYIEAVKKESVLGSVPAKRDVRLVFTPLNGTGLEPVTRVLIESGFTNITVVREQAEPNGSFPTCPKPNPEEAPAMELGLEYCRKYNADLLLASDPDADRLGIAVKKPDGEYVLLSANELGVLLLDYICTMRIRNGTMPPHPVFMKTIVTTELAEKIADSYGVSTVNTLTGFKYIGEQICELEKKQREKEFIFGLEESYGFLTGTYVRDKDAVNAALHTAEMFAYLAAKGTGLYERLQELYAIHGYCLNTQHSYQFEGSAGMERMKEIMEELRSGKYGAAGIPVNAVIDYQRGIDGLPKSNVLKFLLNHGSMIVRPSGTEPKLKVYCSITADKAEQAEKIEHDLASRMDAFVKQ